MLGRASIDAGVLLEVGWWGARVLESRPAETGEQASGYG